MILSQNGVVTLRFHCLQRLFNGKTCTISVQKRFVLRNHCFSLNILFIVGKQYGVFTCQPLLFTQHIHCFSIAVCWSHPVFIRVYDKYAAKLLSISLFFSNDSSLKNNNFLDNGLTFPTQQYTVEQNMLWLHNCCTYGPVLGIQSLRIMLPVSPKLQPFFDDWIVFTLKRVLLCRMLNPPPKSSLCCNPNVLWSKPYQLQKWSDWKNTMTPVAPASSHHSQSSVLYKYLFSSAATWNRIYHLSRVCCQAHSKVMFMSLPKHL